MYNYTCTYSYTCIWLHCIVLHTVYIICSKILYIIGNIMYTIDKKENTIYSGLLEMGYSSYISVDYI